MQQLAGVPSPVLHAPAPLQLWAPPPPPEAGTPGCTRVLCLPDATPKASTLSNTHHCRRGRAGGAAGRSKGTRVLLQGPSCSHPTGGRARSLVPQAFPARIPSFPWPGLPLSLAAGSAGRREGMSFPGRGEGCQQGVD